MDNLVILEISGCSASNNQEDYNCKEAFDGITNGLLNGWAYNAKSPAWVVFDLKKKSPINSLALMNGRQRNDHRLINFKISMKMNDNQWINPNGLSVREVSNADIGVGGTISLKSGLHVLNLDFKTIENVKSIKLDVTKTDASNNNVVLNEIIPKFIESK